MRPLLATALLAAVIIGGFLIGAARGVTDTGPDWLRDLVVAVAIYWSVVGVLSVIAWHVLRWPK